MSVSPAAAGCFSNPSACGYPDPTTTGVPAGTSLTASGSRTVSTNGAVLDGLDITGTVTVSADNVTIQNSRITKTSGGNGSYAVILNNGADNFTIKDTEVLGPASQSNGLESAVWNHYNNPGATALRVNFHRCADCWEGAGTFRDSYMLVDAAYSGSHDENIYVCGDRVEVDHSTLINLHHQTAVVFGDTICGSGNEIIITDSLLAGGGFVVYPQGNSSSAVGSMNISGNRIARCTSSGVYNSSTGGTACSGGADSNGLYPNGGYFGLAAHYYLGGSHVWQNNVWDDSSQAVCPTGKLGCGSSTPPPPPPPPPADTPTDAVWSAPANAKANVAVTLNGSASTGDAPIACRWTVETEAGSILDTRNGCQIGYTFQQEGTQYVRLTVTDADGDVDSNRQSLTVSAATQPPPPPTDTPADAVWAAPPTAHVGVPVLLNGSSSTGDAPIDCRWSFEDQSGKTVWETHAGCTLGFTFQLTGAKYVRLTVEDADGDLDSDRKSFSVSTPSSEPDPGSPPGSETPTEPSPPDAPSGPPAPAPGPTPIPSPADIPAKAIWSAPADVRTGDRVTLDGTGSLGDRPLRCIWTFLDSRRERSISPKSGCRVSVRFQRAGTQYVRLAVRDANGSLDSLERPIAVRTRSSTAPRWGWAVGPGGSSRTAVRERRGLG